MAQIGWVVVRLRPGGTERMSFFAIVVWIGEDRGTLVCSAVQMADRKPVPTFGLHCDSEAVGDLGKTLVEGPERRVRGESR